MESILTKAIQSAQRSKIAFTKFITPNDTGVTGGHQAGYHIHKNAWRLFFEEAGVKGSNKDTFVTIKWQDSFETSSRFIYYGVGTRNEYRLTRFGKGFPFLGENNVGDLLVLCKEDKDFYLGYILQTEDEIEDFFAALNISSTDTNKIIPKQLELSAEEKLLQCFDFFLKSVDIEFPTTLDIATTARSCYKKAYDVTSEKIRNHPDLEILQWINTEFQLFKFIENDRYSKRIQSPFNSVEELIGIANTILNRRKSRAGKSLEHHLAEVFRTFELQFDTQAVTEDNKKPDFLFPGQTMYRNKSFNDEKLIMLASKTTCKDRWRQILNEADRIKTKHLFTLQQGISKNQLDEMYKYDVCLVVPAPFLTSFPKEYRDKILPLNQFISFVKAKQK